MKLEHRRKEQKRDHLDGGDEVADGHGLSGRMRWEKAALDMSTLSVE